MITLSTPTVSIVGLRGVLKEFIRPNVDSVTTGFVLDRTCECKWPKKQNLCRFSYNSGMDAIGHGR